MTEQTGAGTQETNALAGWGLLAGLLVPLLGLVFGVILAAKGRVNVGAVVMIWSVACGYFWADFLGWL